MATTLLDCYTDEPAGLGVPPYLGTYPRYIAGSLNEPVFYLTIDDIRFFMKYSSKHFVPKPSQKTDIFTYNLTKNADNVKEILEKTDTLIVILGVHVPGKYLSAMPGTLHELIPLISDLKCKKILTGPAVFGTQLHGGKMAEIFNMSGFACVRSGLSAQSKQTNPEHAQEPPASSGEVQTRRLLQQAVLDTTVFGKVDTSLFSLPYDDIKEYAVKGASILSQLPDIRMIEIEAARGCDIGKCSFCTEPLKSAFESRQKEDILAEIKEFYRIGARYFRIGKQSCFYTIPKAQELLKDIRKICPEIKVLHIDNCNPVKVVLDSKNNGAAITKAIVKYCTPGNVAAMGVESFDKEVVKQNSLNCLPETAFEAVKILNKHGAERSSAGLPKYLPGINIIFGLKGETKLTHQKNMEWLKRIYDECLMLRRINIRQVAVFPGTELYKNPKGIAIRKNKKYYWKWRNDIRQNIDSPMLKRLIPEGTVLKGCYAEIYDGKTTFCRQFGTYPLIVGVKERLPLKQFFNVRITGHMLRSVVGEKV